MDAATTLRADARRNRERIVAAARTAFAEEGIDCRMADVAARAGVGNATVFRHFPTKADLVAELMLARMTQLLALADEALESPDAFAGLERLLGELSDALVQDHALKESAAINFAGDDRLRGARDAMLERLGTLVSRSQAAGRLRDDVSPVDLVVLLGAVAHSTLGLEEQRPGLHRRYLALALAGLRAEARGATPLPEGTPTPDELDAAWAAEAQRRCAPG